MPLSIRRAIAAIEVDEIWEGRGDDRQLVGYTRKVKLWDKVKGIELMARKHKMLTDKHEVAGRITLADLLAAP
jgi:phage terminase small subunit